ncbi:sulfotransferase family protein [Paenibacillus glycanilyticus]|uniref:sulfotransferase family 2 domain-containing protein n=1 Tax=Paenibacillus glycanilyticus TaxID=126569 RepID=UPI00203A4F99|nr:sulfotransferase family 2 domain-containing protein [Paenibacillus glycanilyticus]MCM3630049.1 sulfotransferase family protein [Paenibacillus glycanilyticus]
MTDKLLLYLHLPKTGGSSFTQAINENCPNTVHFYTMSNGIQLSERLIHADALCGHFIYGIHHFTDRPFQYVTMLRNPLERTLSYFYFKYKNPKYVISYNKELTFEEYALDPFYDLEYCNLQSRMITGELNNPYPNYKKARDLLANEFAFVGITEQYDMSLYLFMRMMNWEPKHYPKVNVTPGRHSDLKLSGQAVKSILQKNEIDQKLYEYAYRQFNERIFDLSYEQEKKLKAYLREARK